MKTRPKLTLPFGTLAVLIIVVFLMGGGARSDIHSLWILRPIAALALGIGFFTLRREHIIENKSFFLFSAAIVALVIAHLLPLPPEVWSALPGRRLIVEAGALTGQSAIWRPITLSPAATWNALFALLVPLAALTLGVQVAQTHRSEILIIIISLGFVSGVLGIAQSTGDPNGPLYFYEVTNNGAAVGLFANRNHQALLIAMMFPLLAAFAKTSHSSRTNHAFKRWACLAGGGALIPLLLVTGSRSGLFLGATGLIFAALILRRGEKDESQSGRHRSHPIPASLYGLVAASALAFLTFAMSRAEAVRRILDSPESDELRFRIWPEIWDLGWRYFPFGSGIGSFAPVYQIDEPSDLLGVNYVNHAHNDLLEIWMTGGAPALLLLVMAVAWYVNALLVLNKINNSRSSESLFAWVGCALLALLSIASLFDYPIRTPVFSVIFVVSALWVQKLIQKGLEIQ